MNEVTAAYAWALRTEFMVFYEKGFGLLEPGTEFLDNWHLHAIAEALRKVEQGESRRLVINIPPRYGKSLLVTIVFTAWLLGRNPRLKIICTSYSESLAKTHARAFRIIVRSDWFRQTFPAFKFEHGSNRAVETITTQSGYRYAVSLGGPVLGRGADIIIGDDVMSPAAALSDVVRTSELNRWKTAHITRLNKKRTGSIILISQRLHAEDLAGHALESGEWDRLIIPAIAPETARYCIGSNTFYDRPIGEVLHAEREPQEILDETRRSMGHMHFAAQYMQDPAPADGNLIHRE